MFTMIIIIVESIINNTIIIEFQRNFAIIIINIYYMYFTKK